MFLISRIRAETPSQELFIYMKSSCEGIFCVAEEDIVPLPGRVSGPAAGSRKSEDPAEEIKKVYYFCRTCDISFNLLKNF